jgi:hypothetical protein
LERWYGNTKFLCLKELNFSFNHVTDEVNLITAVAHNPKLTYFDISGNPFA